MLTYLPRRLLSLIPTLFIILVLTFILIRLVPGDPVRTLLGESSTPQAEAVLRAKLGLDQPPYVQFARYVQTVFTGDLGNSLRTKRPVLQEIATVFPHTLLLALTSLLVSLCISLPLGIYAARKRGSAQDIVSMIIAILGRSMPLFWVAVILLLVFSLKLGWLPTIGTGDFDDPVTLIKSLILPSLALGFSEAAFLSRVMRSSMLEVLGSDYIRAARARGVGEFLILFKHALRNSLVPLLTVAGLSFGRLLGGSVAVERVFSRSGMGNLLVNSILSRDYPMVQGIILVFAALFCLINVAVDVSYGLVDPRVRYQ
jgi:peptide/nickel transport system permease protein/oligopeptide transport system permease protein